MKIILLLTIVLFAFESVEKTTYAQSPQWQWAKSAGGTSVEQANAVATDINGNVYVAGLFNSDSITFGATTLINAGGDDLFLAKYDSNGTVLWAKRAGGTNVDHASCVATDVQGNVYIAGYFNSDSITFGATVLKDTGVFPNYDIYIAKYDANGTELWAKRQGGTNFDQAWGICIDDAGNVHLTGKFSSDSIVLGSYVLINVGGSDDMYIVKYNSYGTILWAASAGGTGNDWARDIAVDHSGNVYVTGDYYSSSLSFGSTVLTNAGFNDIFIAKYDSSGIVQWARKAGGTDLDLPRGLCTDAIGNVYLTGEFYSPTISFGTTLLSTVGSSDIFLAKYDSAGTALWATRSGGTTYDEGWDVFVDDAGEVLLAGNFQSNPATFGSILLPHSGGFNDLFITKYDSSGTALWAKSATGLGNDFANSVSAFEGGNIYIAGRFGSPSLTFGSSILFNPNVSFDDVFIAKLGTGSLGIDENCFTNELNVFPNPFYSAIILKTKKSMINASIAFVNMLGQTAMEILNVGGTEFVIPRGDLATGLYFLTLIEGDKKIAARKLVVAD
jgi:hypothetical protein